MKHIGKMAGLALSAVMAMTLAVPAFAADYSFSTAAPQDYYGSTSYEDVYGSQYNYGGRNVTDYDLPELEYGRPSTTMTGEMEQVILPGLQGTAAVDGNGGYGIGSYGIGGPLDGTGGPSVLPALPDIQQPVYTSVSGMVRADGSIGNTSNVPLSEFYWHDRVPTDAARATVLTTGTYSARLNYQVLYKTNYRSDYQLLASNLLTSSNYSFHLNAIPMQAGEHVTDIRFEFGKVPVGFQSVAKPTLMVQVLGTAANNYQLVNRADVGGKYQGTWQTAQASWLTIVRRLGPVPTLPQTGY